MSWITVLWSMIPAACLTLAAVHGLVWWWRRAAWANLLFALAALATAALAVCELWAMRAETPEQMALALRWLHVPVWALVVALVGFVLLHLRAGRPRLACAVVGLRTLSLLLDFTTGVNLNYREITGIQRMDFLGETVSVAAGVPNPWMLIGQVSLLLLVAFTIDASRSVWRRRDRFLALVVGGSIATFAALGTAQAILAFWGLLPMPITASLFYVGIVAAMGFELSRDLLRAAELSDELRLSEQQMSMAAEAANLGLWVWDIGRDEIWATPRCRVMFGFSRWDRITGADFFGRVHPEDREATQRILRDAVAQKLPYDHQYRLVLPDGRERWISALGRVDQTAARVNGVCRDVTAQRRDEQEAQLLRQELAHVGRVSMMGQLASALAHEINQPLGAILRNAEAAELFLESKTPDLEEIRAILGDIRRDDVRAGTVIDRMRALLKRRGLETRLLPVAEIVGDVVALVRADATDRQVRLAVEVPGGLPLVMGDRVHLQQVLLNLIVNGMDALASTPPPYRCVSVSARCDGAQAVEITVSDTGPGIPTDHLTRVFQPFFTTKPDGMGMGLQISRTIIDAHRGRLWAEDRAGGGATFRFTVPIAAEAAVA